MGKVIWIIVLIIVAVALYNTFTGLGNGFKFENFSALIKFPAMSNRTATATVSYSVNGGNPTTVSKNLGSSQPANSQPTQPVQPAIVPPAGFTLSQLSPYYGQVKIGSPSQGNNYSPSQFSVRADYSLKAPVDITGWSVKSNQSILFVPRAVSNYVPSGLAPSSDIILGSGDYVNFYNTYSPVGVSLRLNSCTGYLNQSYKFNPTLPENCPTLYSRTEIAPFSGACQSLITSLWSCSVPTPDQVNSLPSSDSDCRSLLLNRFNYNGCYNYRHNDADFFSHEWRVWLQSQINFDWSHDRLLLFDKNNLLVDEYYY